MKKLLLVVCAGVMLSGCGSEQEVQKAVPTTLAETVAETITETIIETTTAEPESEEEEAATEATKETAESDMATEEETITEEQTSTSEETTVAETEAAAKTVPEVPQTEAVVEVQYEYKWQEKYAKDVSRGECPEADMTLLTEAVSLLAEDLGVGMEHILAVFPDDVDNVSGMAEWCGYYNYQENVTTQHPTVFKLNVSTGEYGGVTQK